MTRYLLPILWHVNLRPCRSRDSTVGPPRRRARDRGHTRGHFSISYADGSLCVERSVESREQERERQTERIWPDRPVRRLALRALGTTLNLEPEITPRAHSGVIYRKRSTLGRIPGILRTRVPPSLRQEDTGGRTGETRVSLPGTYYRRWGREVDWGEFMGTCSYRQTGRARH